MYSIIGSITFERLYGWVEFGVSAVIILGLLILVHEFGHFIVARMVGVRVEKFSIGFGRKIFGRKAGDTEYMVSWIPLGGYVKFYGDDPDSDENDEESFMNQDVRKRLAIVSAGPLFNIATAVLIVALAAFIGLPEGTRVIDQVVKDTPAEAAGIQPGDRIDAIHGVPMETWGQVRETIQKAPGKQLTFELLRATGERETITITPAMHKAKTIDGKEIVIGRIGVIPRQVIISYPPLQALI